jgi:hypothetical protein
MEKERKPIKKAWTAPQLTVYGDVAKITAADPKINGQTDCYGHGNHRDKCS